MLTLQELKQIVAVPVPGQKIPSAKNLIESGKIVARKSLDPDTEITAYENGYALYSACLATTVFPIHQCGEYQYDTEKNPCSIEDKFFEKENWYLRLVLEGEDRLYRNQEAKERKKTISYSAVSEEWKIMGEEKDSLLERMVWKETKAELLAILTMKQRIAVCGFFLGQKTQEQIAEEMGVTISAVSKILTRAIRRMQELEFSEM